MRSSVEECSSIIHAKAYPINVIEDIWGVKVDGKEVSVINIDTALSGGGYGYNAHNRAFPTLRKTMNWS